MKNLLAKRRSSQEDYQKLGGKSCESFVELKVGGVEGEVQQEESHSSSKSEFSSSQTSPNESRESGAENLPQPPQYEISQKASLVNEQENLHHRPSLGKTQVHRDRHQQEQVRQWPHHQWAKADQGTPSTQDSQYKSFHQHESEATSLSFLGRILQWAKLSALLLGATSIAAIVLKYPWPSSYQQQPSVNATSPSPNPMPTVVPPSPLPEKELSPPEIPLAQLPPVQAVPIPPPPTLSSLPESQNPTLSVDPSPAKIPNPTEANKLSSPSPSASVPVIPPSLISQLPLTPPPCPHQAAAKVATPTDKANQNTRLNNNTQVAEVRNYLQQRWNPPSGLTQALEYRLLLNRDGSIERISPVGQASLEYIDRTNIPLPGERFVSALEGEANSKIRVVLTPNGKVQTSLERKG